MSNIRILFCVLLGVFGFMAVTPAFAAEKSATKTHKVDVNNATEEELEELPGVGEVYAKKIIDGRPYKNDEDLVKAGIPLHTVEKIKSQIKFGKEKSSASKKTETKTTSKVHKTDSYEESPNVKKETKATSKSTKVETSDGTAKVPPSKGMVWVNTETMVYHTEGDRWYGNTKNGKFMTEQDAIKAGARKSKQD